MSDIGRILLCYFCYAIFAILFLLCYFCYPIFAMLFLLSYFCYPIFAMLFRPFDFLALKDLKFSTLLTMSITYEDYSRH